MDLNWINVAAGVITVITGVITIVNAFKRKTKAGNELSQPGNSVRTVSRSSAAPKLNITASPSPTVSGVQEFSGDDNSYQEWIKSHPQGFVVNTNQGVNSEYMPLHKASCRHISNFNKREPGAFTEREFMKVCSTDLECLREWAKAHGRADSSFTGNCRCLNS